MPSYEQIKLAARKSTIVKRLRAVVHDGAKLLIIRTGGTSQNQLVEVIIARKRGEPDTITQECLVLLGKRRGKKGQGGMRLSNWENATDVTTNLSEALGRKLTFSTY